MDDLISFFTPTPEKKNGVIKTYFPNGTLDSQFIVGFLSTAANTAS